MELPPWTQRKVCWSRHLVFAMVYEPYLQHPLEEGPLILLPEIWVWSLAMFLERCQAPKTAPTLKLAPHHYVSCLNLDKFMFNTCFLTHTHTSIHLSIQHGIIHPKTHTYPFIKHKEPNHTHIQMLAFIQHMKTVSYHTSKTRQQLNHGSKVSWQS